MLHTIICNASLQNTTVSQTIQKSMQYSVQYAVSIWTAFVFSVNYKVRVHYCRFFSVWQ